jgi:hypothetical protein
MAPVKVSPSMDQGEAPDVMIGFVVSVQIKSFATMAAQSSPVKPLKQLMVVQS